MDFVESGFRACWRNAKALVSASEKLMNSGHQALALSISVLALEEMGKLFAVDGLLYARQSDAKSEGFCRSLRDHKTKLAFLEALPILFLNLTRSDPRYGHEERFMVALKISAQDLKEAGNTVMRELGENNFLELDHWKQRGFYASNVPEGTGFIAPSEAVSPALANAVNHLAWRAETTLDFILKDGNLERYLDQARRIRAALTEDQHQELERRGQEIAADIGFLGAEDEPGGLTNQVKP